MKSGEKLRLEKIFGVMGPLLFGLGYLDKKKKYLWAVIAAGFISTVSRMFVPLLIGNAVGSIQAFQYSSVEHFALLIVLASAVSGIMQFIVNYGAQYLSQVYSYNLRNDVFGHLLRKKIGFYENQTSGDLLSRTTMDIEATRNYILTTLAQLIPTIFMIGFSFVALLSLSVEFAAIFLLTVPVLILIGLVFQQKQRTHWRRIRTYYGLINEHLQENIVGNRVVRGFSAERQEIDKFSETTGQFFQENMEIGRLRGKYNNMMPLAVGAAATVILLYGGFVSIINGSNVGPLVSAVNIFSIISFPVSFLGRMIVFSENSKASILRINEIKTPENEEELSAVSEIYPNGDLSFRNVSFRRGDREILRNISFEVRTGEFVGLTGRTAAGKSSLVNLISGFSEPCSGRILIGDKALSEFPLSSLRKAVAVVPQEITLLSGTVRDNIAFGNMNASDDEIKQSAAIARIADFIESLPLKYSTVIGERGITLSGGQRQRVAIARAILTKPGYLILDDATSSVDPETELEIFRNIRKEMTRTAVILVSHRESALKFADRVLKLADGQTSAVPDFKKTAGGMSAGPELRDIHPGGDRTATGL